MIDDDKEHQCPGCETTLQQLTPDDRARIPLREAAHNYHKATEKLFDLVRRYGWHNELVKLQDIEMEKLDGILAMAAKTYALGKH